MAKRQPPKPVIVLRARYGPALGDPRRREKAIRSLRSMASDLRRHGVPEEDNTVAEYLREVAPGVIRGQYPLLVAAGLRDLPTEFRGKTHHWRRTAERLLEYVQAPLADIGADEVEDFLHRPERKLNLKYGNERLYLSVFFDACVAAGRARENPVRRDPRRPQVPETALPPVQREEIAAIRKYHEEHNLTRETEKANLYWYRTGLRYLDAIGDPAGSLDAHIWPEGGAEECARWIFTPKPGTPARFKSSFQRLQGFMKLFWRANDHDWDAIEMRYIRFRQAFRTDRDPRKKQNVLKLRGTRPPSPPESPVVDAALSRLAQEFEEAVANPFRRRAVQRDDTWIRTERSTLARAGSACSFRFDQLKIDPVTRELYFDKVVVKPSRDRDEDPYSEEMILRRGYARWFLDAELLVTLHSLGLAFDMDVMGWLRTGDRRCLKWVKVTSADPFGEIAIGKLVAPVWWTLDGKRPLSRAGFDGLALRIMRRRLGVPDGSTHNMRRLGVDESRKIADEQPRKTAKLHHMEPATRAIYLKSLGNRVARHPGGGRTVDEVLQAALGEASFEIPIVRPAARSVPATGSLVAFVQPTEVTMVKPMRLRGPRLRTFEIEAKRGRGA